MDLTKHTTHTHSARSHRLLIKWAPGLGWLLPFSFPLGSFAGYSASDWKSDYSAYSIYSDFSFELFIQLFTVRHHVVFIVQLFFDDSSTLLQMLVIVEDILPLSCA